MSQYKPEPIRFWWMSVFCYSCFHFTANASIYMPARPIRIQVWWTEVPISALISLQMSFDMCKWIIIFWLRDILWVKPIKSGSLVNCIVSQDNTKLPVWLDDNQYDSHLLTPNQMWGQAERSVPLKMSLYHINWVTSLFKQYWVKP